MKEAGPQTSLTGQARPLLAWRVVERLLTACLAIALFAVPAAAQDASTDRPPIWALAGGDIAPDPAVKFGELPNGMRYALMANRLPPGAAAIRFVVGAGSLQEAEDERGLVHFIEHMAFNGSRRVPEGELVKTLQRLGLAFGADANAATTRTETVYMFDLPDASAASIDQSLFLLREIASELVFGSAAIERERGVILAEQRRGDTVESRRAEKQLDFLFPGAYVAARPPIGDSTSIEKATRDSLVDLYDRLYRPERSLLIVVGDIDPAAVESRILDAFGGWSGKGPAPPGPVIAYNPIPRAPAAFVYAHPDGGDSIAVYRALPFERLTDSVAVRRKGDLFNLAMGILARRFARLAEGPSPPFRRASMNYYDVWDAVDVVSASASIVPGAWEPALESLEQEWRRALVHGFTEEEVAEQLAQMRAGLAQAAERANTRSTPQLATQLLGALLDDAVFSDPRSDLARFESWASTANAALVHDLFASTMKMDDPLFLLATSVPLAGAEEGIPRVWAESGRVPVEPPAKRSTAAFAYPSFGVPGQVTSDIRLPEIDARLVTFANNVRLNIKRTAFQDNTVLVSLRVGDGALGLEDGPPGLAALMTAYSAGGLEQHTLDDLRSMFSGRIVQATFGVQPDAFGATYMTTPQDLGLQLQLAAAFMLHPGYRADAESRWRENIALASSRLDASAASVFSSRAIRLLMSGDTRFGSDPADEIADRTFAELRSYAGPMLQEGAIEIAVVGDVTEEQVISLVAATFGALPARKPAQSMTRSTRPVQFRPSGSPLVLTHAGEATQAMVQFYWPADLDPATEPQAVRTLSVLGAVMRLKIVAALREQLGESYAPSAGATVSEIYPGLGYVFAGAEVTPQKVDATTATIRAIASDLREGRISTDELERAIQPSLEQLPAHASENAYWLAVLAQAQGRPDRQARLKLDAIAASIRAVSIPELVEAAKRWLTDTNVREIRILPSKEG